MKIRVTGDYACFTRPEYKIERFSYPIITPTAAKGLVKNVFWKPQIDYIIKKIYVVKAGTFMSLGIIKEHKELNGLSSNALRTSLKHMTVLKDVEYVLDVEQTIISDKVKASKVNTVSKYKEMLRKRLCKGKYFRTPYLGMAGFPCSIIEEVDQAPVTLDTSLTIIPGLLIDIRYKNSIPEAIFADVVVKNGILEVPTC
jgi:CRISPR-associated protein Cas5d